MVVVIIVLSYTAVIRPILMIVRSVFLREILRSRIVRPGMDKPIFNHIRNSQTLIITTNHNAKTMDI